jgi:hypothetical protein
LLQLWLKWRMNDWKVHLSLWPKVGSHVINFFIKIHFLWSYQCPSPFDNTVYFFRLFTINASWFSYFSLLTYCRIKLTCDSLCFSQLWN